MRSAVSPLSKNYIPNANMQGTTSGNTRLHYVSAIKPDETRIHNLIKDGEKIDTLNDAGETPLILAVKLAASSEKIVMRKLIMNLLILHGANINATDKQGNTCLHVLIKNSIKSSQEHTVNLVNFLLEKGADKKAVNSNDESPLMLARKHKLEQVVKVLEKYEDKKTAVLFYSRSLDKISSLCTVFEKKSKDNINTKTTPRCDFQVGPGKVKASILFYEGAGEKKKVQGITLPGKAA